MREKNDNTDQNRFTAYLVAAIKNKRISYLERRYRLSERECVYEEIRDNRMDSFESQFHEYINRQADKKYGNPVMMLEILETVESGRIIRAVGKLREDEQRLLFGRVFGGQSFQELGQWLGVSPKQAEMAYYYIIRKVREENI